MDQFGYYENSEYLFNSLIPSISARKEGKVIITSTGGEFFDELYLDAKNKLNSFEPFEIRWWQCYKKNDLDKIRNMIGDIDSFKKEYLLK